MLKKAGIIVAAVATGVLAVSSLAFADTSTGNLKNDCAFGNAGGAPRPARSAATAWWATWRVVTGAASITTQTNTRNCNNVQLKDLLDQGSNNKSKTKVEREVEDSFNS